MAEAGVVGVKVELGTVGSEEQELATLGLALDVEAEEGLPDLGDEEEGADQSGVQGPAGGDWRHQASWPTSELFRTSSH